VQSKEVDDEPIGPEAAPEQTPAAVPGSSPTPEVAPSLVRDAHRAHEPGRVTADQGAPGTRHDPQQGALAQALASGKVHGTAEELLAGRPHVVDAGAPVAPAEESPMAALVALGPTTVIGGEAAQLRDEIDRRIKLRARAVYTCMEKAGQTSGPLVGRVVFRFGVVDGTSYDVRLQEDTVHSSELAGCLSYNMKLVR
jgi:hypothetical protein